MDEALRLSFAATPEKGAVTALLRRPADARALYVFGHGASTTITHRGMETLSQALAAVQVATFRYNFPYAEHGRGRDAQPALLETVRSACQAATAAAPGLPLLAGGRSMSGRMTSLAASQQPLPDVRGLVFVGFPLHPAGRPGTERAEHLSAVTIPMLFLQGTRDELADLELLRPVIDGLGDRATLHIVETADHSFKVQKKSGLSPDDVDRALAGAVAEFAQRVCS